VDLAAALTFRRLERRDLPELSSWLSDPEVGRWWPDDRRLDALESSYGPGIDGVDPTEVFVVEIGGRSSGIIQRYRTSDDPSWQETLRRAMPALGEATAGIDYLLGRPEVRRRGVGTKMIDVFSGRLFDELADVTAIVVAVQQANRPSWRALERAGYRRVWAGTLASSDPSDAGASYLYRRDRLPPGRHDDG
jgi:aminoglycoside 6'-N-acetyltransferase